MAQGLGADVYLPHGSGRQVIKAAPRKLSFVESLRESWQPSEQERELRQDRNTNTSSRAFRRLARVVDGKHSFYPPPGAYVAQACWLQFIVGATLGSSGVSWCRLQAGTAVLNVPSSGPLLPCGRALSRVPHKHDRRAAERAARSISPLVGFHFSQCHALNVYSSLSAPHSVWVSGLVTHARTRRTPASAHLRGCAWPDQC